MPDDEVLHLCSEVGRPAVWPLAAFGRRERYKTLLGGLRTIPPGPLRAGGFG
ncbi:hypothetical protein JNW88_12360 [Micromonospora sp. ATA32]|nr:hypothetical protein [Micromonospora sp. ATA32]